MIFNANLNCDDLSAEWAIRSEFWLSEIQNSQRKRRIRERNSNALTLTGQGTSLKVDAGTLVIRQGLTHYPQSQEHYRFFKGDLELPRIIILLDGSGSISFDVLNWLGEQGVALARIKGDGDIAIMASGAGFTADPANLQWQYALQKDQTARFHFARDLIAQKLANSITTLREQFDGDPASLSAIAKAKNCISRLRTEPISEMNTVRAIEGEAAVSYFAAWAALKMQWTTSSRYPVPPQWRTYRSRSSILTGHKAKNWKASHPINAMLNYAYAVKATQLQIKTVADGYDPFAGIMHHSRPGFPAYVYDLIEPERPKVDGVVLGFTQSKKFSGADFVLRKDGACRLSPQLARMIAGLIT